MLHLRIYKIFFKFFFSKTVIPEFYSKDIQMQWKNSLGEADFASKLTISI